MTHVFEPLGLHPQLIQAVTTLGFTNPTPIQSGVMPLLPSGQGMTGQSHTGTGKTHVLPPTGFVGTIAYYVDLPRRTTERAKRS